MERIKEDINYIRGLNYAHVVKTVIDCVDCNFFGRFGMPKSDSEKVFIEHVADVAASILGNLNNSVSANLNEFFTDTVWQCLGQDKGKNVLPKSIVVSMSDSVYNINVYNLDENGRSKSSFSVAEYPKYDMAKHMINEHSIVNMHAMNSAEKLITMNSAVNEMLQAQKQPGA